MITCFLYQLIMLMQMVTIVDVPISTVEIKAAIITGVRSRNLLRLILGSIKNLVEEIAFMKMLPPSESKGRSISIIKTKEGLTTGA